MHFETWHLDLVANCPVARLATIGPAGLPNLVPVCYALIDGKFVIAIDEKPKSGRRLARLRNIDADPRVSLLIDHYEDDWLRLAWLRIEGTAVAIPGASWPEALAALRQRYPQYRSMALELNPLIVVAPQRTASWRWQAPADRPKASPGDGSA